MIVLDSDILVDLLRKEPSVVASLQSLRDSGEPLGTTSVNLAEILRGANRDATTLSKTLQILSGLHEIPFGPRAARRFGTIMHALDKVGKAPPAIDGMIAAAVIEEGGRLATRNRRHFERIPGLELLPLPSPS